MYEDGFPFSVLEYQSAEAIQQYGQDQPDRKRLAEQYSGEQDINSGGEDDFPPVDPGCQTEVLPEKVDDKDDSGEDENRLPRHFQQQVTAEIVSDQPVDKNGRLLYSAGEKKQRGTDPGPGKHQQ